MIDHLIERGNIRDLGIALVIALALAALVAMFSGCSPQQSASYMPMMGMGNSMASQAMNLYQQQQNMQRQAELQRQQEYLLYLQQQRQNQHFFNNGSPAD